MMLWECKNCAKLELSRSLIEEITTRTIAGLNTHMRFHELRERRTQQAPSSACHPHLLNRSRQTGTSWRRSWTRRNSKSLAHAPSDRSGAWTSPRTFPPWTNRLWFYCTLGPCKLYCTRALPLLTFHGPLSCSTPAPTLPLPQLSPPSLRFTAMPLKIRNVLTKKRQTSLLSELCTSIDTKYNATTNVIRSVRQL